MNHTHTIEQLRALRLAGMAEAFAHQMSDAVFASLAFESRVQMLIDAEKSQRDNQRYRRILKNAKLKVIAAGRSGSPSELTAPGRDALFCLGTARIGALRRPRTKAERC